MTNDNLLPELRLQAEAEKAVLAAALSVQLPEVLNVIACLPSKCFYFVNNRRIWKAIRIAKKVSPVVDAILVHEMLEKHNINVSPVYLNQVMNSYASSANINIHATFIVEYYMRMKVKSINSEYAPKYDSMYNDLLVTYDEQMTKLKNVYEECYSIIKKINGQGSASVIDIVDEEFSAMEKDVDRGTVSGVPYGIPNMDGKVDLMVPGDMVVIAARPGMGKTIMAVQIAIHAALKLNLKVHFHSLEMTRSKLAQRIIAMYTSHTTNDILYRKLSKEEIKKARNEFREKFNDNLQLFDDADINVERISDAGEKDHVGLIVLDYLQLVPDNDKDKKTIREQEVSAISRGVKRTAMKLKIPFIALSQLSRKVEERHSNKYRPIPSDIRESGSIEQDADTILMLYRPEVYKIKSTRYPPNITEIIVAKQRNGARPVVPALFDSKTNQFIYYDNSKESNEDDSESESPVSERYGGNTDEAF